MTTSILEVQDSFGLLFSSLIDRTFSKSLYLEHKGEKSLLPLVRTFLLGYFGKSVVPEVQAKLPGALTGMGRLDFTVDDVAVEFAVRRPGTGAHIIGARINETEMKKLLKYDGKALLVLFDFTDKPLTSNDLEMFRIHPSMGKGRHRKSPFQISYFYKNDDGSVGQIRKVIRVN